MDKDKKHGTGRDGSARDVLCLNGLVGLGSEVLSLALLVCFFPQGSAGCDGLFDLHFVDLDGLDAGISRLLLRVWRVRRRTSFTLSIINIRLLWTGGLDSGAIREACCTLRLARIRLAAPGVWCIRPRLWVLRPSQWGTCRASILLSADGSDLKLEAEAFRLVEVRGGSP
ncbi:uncharacterized protein F5Z01DRAFT_232533 [Emericellopsis atlantica]|uniref:Uncharacterized protein n=1 Tax=Emericellopsis atlantica TaxID=2614577 RepID=A0A9P8CMJ9_9HYPO|nr:uncharacterized protein F5Z01DRAFT_232533 [Emericellopsis atlantica]KAG9252523.1 hypothetical protein F5Z01DRAFT_232533 [Emericellopsis atlantica]